jgi:hypothetical protein
VRVNKAMLTLGLTLVGMILWTAVAQAGTAKLTATVDPATAGSTATPAPHTVTASLTNIAAGSDGNPTKPLITLTESFPAGFQANLGPFGVCTKVAEGDNKPVCPDNSLLGHASATAYIPSLKFKTLSDDGYVWKTGDNRIGMWVHVSKPTTSGVVLYATVTRGAAPFGPIITWDTTPLADGTQKGLEIDVSALKVSYDASLAANGSSTPTPPSNARKLRSCNAKAKRIKNKKKRRAALRRCAKRYPKRPTPPPPSAITPFQSTNCTGGSWLFHDDLVFFDKSTDAAESKVTCQ